MNEFFTLPSMLTLSGATGATFVIANGCQRAFNFNPKWLALLVAEGISLLGVVVIGGAGAIEYFVGFVNGFLIYCTAAGATSTVGEPNPPAIRAREAGEESISRAKRAFLTQWF